MEDEGGLFEGLRLGSRQAFEELLGADDAAMRRLARLYVTDEQVAPLVRQTWSVALPGLDMFTWHTTLRAWLTGILVTYGRAWRSPPAVPPTLPEPSDPPDPADAAHQGAGARGRSTTVTVATAPVPVPAPVPWSSLGWSSLWSSDSWSVLEEALAARPLAEQEVLWLHDVEGWSWRETLDTLGLTAVQGTDLQHRGRAALAVAVAEHVGTDPAVTTAEEQQRLEGVAVLLSALRPRQQDTAPDPQLLRTFTTWRRQRGVHAWRRWRWELGRAWLRSRRARGR